MLHAEIMKLIYAIVSNDDSSMVSSSLTKAGFFTTKLSSTGGFLKAGNTTFMIATEDENVDAAIEIITKHSKRRSQMTPTSAATYGMGSYSAFPIEVSVGGATIFVTNIERFEKV